VLLIVSLMLAVPLSVAAPARAGVCDAGCQVLQRLEALRGETVQLFPHRIAHTFIVKIDAAERAVQRASFRAALGQVRAIAGELNGLVQGGQVVYATAVEYGIMVAAIAAVIITTVFSIGGKVEKGPHSTP
jgi:hypothetical protein